MKDIKEKTHWHCKTHNADIPLDDAEKRIARHEEFHSLRLVNWKSSLSQQPFRGNVNTQRGKCDWVLKTRNI